MNIQTQEKSEDTKSNVVQLRNAITDTQAYNALQSIEYLKDTKREFCDEVLEFTLEHMFNCLNSAGFFTHNRKVDAREIVLIEQALQCMLYKYYGLDHPFDGMAADIIKLDGDEELEEEVVSDEDLPNT